MGDAATRARRRRRQQQAERRRMDREQRRWKRNQWRMGHQWQEAQTGDLGVRTMKPGYGETWVLREDQPSRYSGQFPSPPSHTHTHTNVILPTELWETSTSKTLSQTALTIQSPSSYPAWCLRSRGELPKTVNQSLLCGTRVVVRES